ncbi:hypothetical protein LJC10_05320, partial [Selenomonadales bacterium OttesenSCG-928-I06]|nr:hypothetical protein [Selenomonadales bacterium OttesenSCG-928-I06]
MRKPLIHKIVLLLTLVFLLGITTSCASQNISQKPSDYLGPIPREKLICVYTDAKENKYYVSKDDIDRIVASGSYEKDRTYEI